MNQLGEKLYITIHNHRQTSVICKVSQTSLISRIIDACAERWDWNANTLVLMYDAHSFTIQSTLRIQDIGLLEDSDFYCCTNDVSLPYTINDSEEDPSMISSRLQAEEG